VRAAPQDRVHPRPSRSSPRRIACRRAAQSALIRSTSAEGRTRESPCSISSGGFCLQGYSHEAIGEAVNCRHPDGFLVRVRHLAETLVIDALGNKM
jgi:hypothetical protein